MYSEVEQYIRDSLGGGSVAYGHLAGNGPVARLEALLRSHYGAKHALCVDSATNALMYLLLAAGLQRSELLTTPLSFGGTLAGGLALGCTFHFGDVDSTLGLSAASCQPLLRAGHRIRAVISVDFAGNPHRMEELHRVCSEAGVWHFVDAAQSLGADRARDGIAGLCDAMVVSFGSGKAVFAGGEGGAVITDDTDLFRRLLSVSQHPHRQERDLGIGASHEFALNGRMHPVAAMLACASFSSGLDAVREKRESFNAALDILSSFPSVSSVFDQRASAFYHCPFLVSDPDRLGEEFRSSPLRTGFFYGKAPFVPLPVQLERAGLGKAVRSCCCPHLGGILDGMYLLRRTYSS